MRLDSRLVALGIAPSRARAKELICGGQIRVNGVPLKKASAEVSDSDEILCTGGQLPFVGRGGLKLAGGLEQFGVSLAGLICLDIGASTGGFTDCMLQNGAAQVYALDVGHDQLARKLRQDARVVNLEGVNIRDVRPADYPAFDFIGTDVSFLSLGHVFPAAAALLKEGGSMIALIKPQFEAGPQALNKHGVVKQPRDHMRSIETVLASAQQNGFSVQGLIPSPIRGGSGNREYLLYLKKGGISRMPDAAAVIRCAFAAE